MRHAFDGIRMVFRDRSLWRYSAAPLAGAAALFLLIAAGAYVLVVPVLRAGLERVGLNPQQSALGGTLAFLVALVFVSGVLFVALAGFLSSFLWDRLSLEVERRETGSAPESRIARSALIGDSLSRLALTLGLGLLACCTGWIVFLIPIAVAGFIGLVDFTAPAFQRRGVLLGEQMRRIWRLEGALGFLAAAGVLTLFPFVNVLLLPGLVAGGTLMVARSRSTAVA